MFINYLNVAKYFRFNFLCKNYSPFPPENHPPLSQQPPSKNWDPVQPHLLPFWKFGRRLKPPPAEIGGGVHTMSWINLISALNFPKQWVADYRYVFRTLSNPLDYLSCLAVVLRGIHRKVYIYQTDCSIHSELRIFPCSEVTQGSTISKPKKV